MAALTDPRAGATDVVAIARRLIAVASPNPPGDTRAVAQAAAEIVREAVPTAEVTLHAANDSVVNLVARVRGAGPGRRLILNGHLDTYPVNETLPWTVDPLGGELRDGRLYGRGAADMKGGIAASIVALATLAAQRDAWRGEAVLTLAGDEESMGVLGTQFLLETVPHARGDAAIIADAGSPTVLRFGEKGFLWVELSAVGTAAHGAHVHRGVNAIDRLRAALEAVARLRDLPVASPEAVSRAIAAARSVSEASSGAGESEVLSRVTVNIGRIEAGTSLNLIPALASAGVDIRLPVGVTTAQAEAAMAAALDPMDGVSYRILRRVEPNYSGPDSPIVRAVAKAATGVLGTPPAINMRVGASDARLFRAAGIPAVVFGPTPFNMGGADEHALVSELDAVAQVHARAAADFLS